MKFGMVRVKRNILRVKGTLYRHDDDYHSRRKKHLSYTVTLYTLINTISIFI